VAFKSNQDISKLTVNLSKLILSDTDNRLLDKGLLFIPTIKTLPINEIIATRDRLTRCLKLKDYFEDEDEDDNFDPKIKTFNNPSTWVPPYNRLSQEVRKTISQINISTNTLLEQLPGTIDGSILLPSTHNNLTKQENLSLHRLKNNGDVVIKSADKGGAIVIVDREAYLTEAYRQLNNAKYYRKLISPIYLDNIDRINDILNVLLQSSFIDAKQFAYLKADRDNCRARVFYLLPKIHKKAESWPQPGRMPEGRPIVSDCGSESYRISEYIESFLSPLSNKHPAYLKDTYDFVSKIRNEVVEDDCLLVTGDVSSLYTNMNLDRILATVLAAFQDNPDPGRPTAEILQLLDITLKNNDFEFNGEYFLQVHGTAMGKIYAPKLADIYLTYFDRMATTGFRIKPEKYYRYLDDVFFKWRGSQQDLDEFNLFLNGIIPDITVTLSCNNLSVDFLDTTVYKCPQGGVTTLQTRVYFKPTDTHQLLHTTSFHPKHTTAGIVKSQVLRFKRLSSSFEDFEATCHTLFSVLVTRGYNRRHLLKTKRDVWPYRHFQTVSAPTAGETTKMIPIVIKYNQYAYKFISLWRNIISENNMFDRFRLVAAYTKNRSIGSYLVRSKLAVCGGDRLPPASVAVPDADTERGAFTRCGSPRCLCCRLHAIPTDSFDSSTYGKRFSINDDLSCCSTNIVYLITCRNCNIQYVGETGRSLASRLTDHRSNIKVGKRTPIAIHFNGPSHTVEDLAAIAIEQIADTGKPITTRRQREAFWQVKLGTMHPRGLNAYPTEEVDF